MNGPELRSQLRACQVVMILYIAECINVITMLVLSVQRTLQLLQSSYLRGWIEKFDFYDFVVEEHLRGLLLSGTEMNLISWR